MFRSKTRNFFYGNNKTDIYSLCMSLESACVFYAMIIPLKKKKKTQKRLNIFFPLEMVVTPDTYLQNHRNEVKQRRLCEFIQHEALSPVLSGESDHAQLVTTASAGHLDIVQNNRKSTTEGQRPNKQDGADDLPAGAQFMGF